MGKVKRVAPDGGWGWMVVVALAVNNFIIVPILQNFGMVYRNEFKDSVDAVTILSTNSAFGYIMGLMNGPLMRYLGYRKVALAGGLLMFVGLFVTSLTNYYLVLFIFYGLINSLGIGLSMAAHFVALSTYFVKNRSMAMAGALTVAGIGPIVMPLVMSELMDSYGARGTVMLLSGLVLNTVCTALLLHPIKWHRKLVYECELPTHSWDQPQNGEITNDNNAAGSYKPIEQGPNKLDLEAEPQSHDCFLTNKVDSDVVKNERWYHTIVEVLDLDLLKDPAFLSMCIGLSVALAADMNFSLLLPLMVGDLQYNIHTIATIQSVVGSADICSRLVTPLLLRSTKISARVAYLISLFCLILTRFGLTVTSRLHSIMVVGFLFGMSKGMRAVFMPLVIPNYVPLGKLPSAHGLQNLLHGLLLVLLGPLVGHLREQSGNFASSIHVMNGLTAVTILLWGVEFVYMKSKKKNTFVDNTDVER